MSEIGPDLDALVAVRWLEVGERVRAACERVRRDPGQIQVVAVTKGQPAAAGVAALRSGLRDLGENRVQEAEGKVGEVGPGPTWHLLGPLQANKVNRALDFCRVLHSVDSNRILDLLATRAEARGRRLEIYLQVNISEEASKHGLPPTDAAVMALAERAAGLSGVRLRGLMGISALASQPEASRPAFNRLAELGRLLRQRWPEGPPGGAGLQPWPGLSMGMSDDYEVAVEEGATCLRLGRALFGGRTLPA